MEFTNELKTRYPNLSILGVRTFSSDNMFIGGCRRLKGPCILSTISNPHSEVIAVLDGITATGLSNMPAESCSACKRTN